MKRVLLEVFGNGRSPSGVHHWPQILPLVVFWLASGAWATEPGECLGPVALVDAPDGKTLYVACADAGQIAWVDVAERKVTRRVDVPRRPTGLVVSPDGKNLIVTCAAPKSTVVVLDALGGRRLAATPAGHTAVGPAITPDGKRLYVCNRFDNEVSVIDLELAPGDSPGAKCEEVARVPVVREPVAAAVTPDGKWVLVANHLPSAAANSFYVTPVVTIIDTATHQTTAVRLPNGAQSLREVCISPDGKFAYVTHVLSNFELVPSQVDQGWTNTNAVTIIDVPERKPVNTVGLDEMYLGAANPWGVGCTGEGKLVCVAHAGTHELSVIDAPALLGTLVQIYISPLVGAIPNDPGIGQGLRRRIKLPGKGPRGLAVVGSKVYVAEYFSDTLAVIDLKAKGEGQVTQIALGTKPQVSERRRGEMLFHDATICYQNWQSCASCHPDGRTDALNWDLMNDSVGNPKNTKSMLLAHKTPPSMAVGVRPTAEEAVRAGIKHILFSEVPEKDSTAIDEYLKSLEPVPSPHLVDGRLSPAAERGKTLFESEQVACHRCHPGPLYTDKLMHDVGSRGLYDVGDRFDTPTLVEVWRTAPYLHDGRYATMKELFVEGKHGLDRGRFEKLSEQQIDDLVEFVLSL